MSLDKKVLGEIGNKSPETAEVAQGKLLRGAEGGDVLARSKVEQERHFREAEAQYEERIRQLEHARQSTDDQAEADLQRELRVQEMESAIRRAMASRRVHTDAATGEIVVDPAPGGPQTEDQVRKWAQQAVVAEEQQQQQQFGGGGGGMMMAPPPGAARSMAGAPPSSALGRAEREATKSLCCARSVARMSDMTWCLNASYSSLEKTARRSMPGCSISSKALNAWCFSRMLLLLYSVASEDCELTKN